MSTMAAPDFAGDADETVGYNVHDLLFRQKRSQKELAFALSITPSVLSKKIRGESAWSGQQIATAARFLNVDPGRLFAELSSQKARPQLRAFPGQGRDPIPRTPLLTPVR